MNIENFAEKIHSYQSTQLSETSIAAAVLVMLIHDDNEIYLILTKRSKHVGDYAGDYCFPGGMKEITDHDFEETVKREVKEELGVDSNNYKIIGQLDDFTDRHGHLVRPYVAMMSKENFDSNYKNFNEEIESMYFFPLRNLHKIFMDEDLEKITKRHPSYKYVEGDVVIWGLTASIMVHLDNILFMKHQQVGKESQHFL